MECVMLAALVERLLKARARHSSRRLVTSRRSASHLELECLEARAPPSTVTWIAGDGDWNVAANWDTGSKPGPTDDAVINTAVTVTHSSGADSIGSLTESSLAHLTLSGGSLAFATTFRVDGTLTLAGGSFNLVHKTIDGSGTVAVMPGATWQLAQSTINPDVHNQGMLQARGGVYLAGSFWNQPGATLTVEGDGTGTVDFETLLVATGFVNDGLIQTVTDALYLGVGLGITSGELINARDGTIHALLGRGGRADLKIVLNNEGTVVVDGPLTVHQDRTFTDLNNGTIDITGADMELDGSSTGVTTFVNSGSINIAPGRTFAFQFNGAQFHNVGGSVSGAGTLMLSGIDATFDGDSDTNGLTVVLDICTYTSEGTVTVSRDSTLTILSRATVNARLANNGVIQVTDGCDFFVNDSLLVNDGLIDLDSGCYLNMTDGVLSNAIDGTIATDSNPAATRTLNTALCNEGDIEVNAPLILARNFTGDVNNGVINVNAGTFEAHLASDGFTNNGTLTVGARSAAVIRYGPLTNFSSGTLAGGTYHIAGTFQFPDAAITTNAANIVLDGRNAQIVDLLNTDALAHLAINTAEGTFTIDNGRNLATAADFSNAGTLGAGPGSTFTVHGNYSQSDTASLAIQLGGSPSSGEYGRLVATDDLGLAGSLSVGLANNYEPAAGDSFSVLAFGSRTGDFASKELPRLENGLHFKARYSSGNLNLIVTAFPPSFTAGDPRTEVVVLAPMSGNSNFDDTSAEVPCDRPAAKDGPRILPDSALDSMFTTLKTDCSLLRELAGRPARTLTLCDDQSILWP
jgi:hypothetical protein